MFLISTQSSLVIKYIMIKYGEENKKWKALPAEERQW